MRIKHIFFLSALILGATFVLTSCSEDEPAENDEPTENDEPAENKVTVSLQSPYVKYNNDNIWEGWNQDDDLCDSWFEFSHDATVSPGFVYVTGFVAARINDNQYLPPMVNHPYTVMPKGGHAGVGTPYLVAYWDSYADDVAIDFDDRSCTIMVEADDDVITFRPVEVYVTNNCYAYYSMKNGDDYARKFAKGDYFKLTAHGVALNGTEKTTEFLLADCSGDNEAEWIVDDWRLWDLSSLGEVAMIYFTMQSSDNSENVMNTPAYFALSGLTAILSDSK